MTIAIPLGIARPSPSGFEGRGLNRDRETSGISQEAKELSTARAPHFNFNFTPFTRMPKQLSLCSSIPLYTHERSPPGWTQDTPSYLTRLHPPTNNGHGLNSQCSGSY